MFEEYLNEMIFFKFWVDYNTTILFKIFKNRETHFNYIKKLHNINSDYMMNKVLNIQIKFSKTNLIENYPIKQLLCMKIQQIPTN